MLPIPPLNPRSQPSPRRPNLFRVPIPKLQTVEIQNFPRISVINEQTGCKDADMERPNILTSGSLQHKRNNPVLQMQAHMLPLHTDILETPHPPRNPIRDSALELPALPPTLTTSPHSAPSKNCALFDWAPRSELLSV